LKRENIFLMFRVVDLSRAREEIEKNWRMRPKSGWVKVREAAGMVLSREVRAAIDFPPFDRAAMDGYALRACDTVEADEEKPVLLKLLGKVKAGEIPKQRIRPGTCLRIETGAPMPRGADAVVPSEFAEEKAMVKIYRPVAPGENVVRRGSRIRRGQILARKGEELNHQRLGVLVAAGVRRVRVFLPPRVGVLSTGNELVEAGGRLAPGKVHDVNGPMLCAALKEIGCRPLWLGIAPDELKVLRGKIERGLRECDLLLITGGTSAGTGDLLPSILPALFHGLAIKPGKPTLFALVRGKPVFGLPGNPLSAFFVFRELVAPYLLKLRGARMKEEMVHAKLSVDLSSERGREEFVLVKLRGEKELEAVPLRQGSDAINLLGLADGYISIPVEIERLRAGETVRVKLLAR